MLQTADTPRGWGKDVDLTTLPRQIDEHLYAGLDGDYGEDGAALIDWVLGTSRLP